MVTAGVSPPSEPRTHPTRQAEASSLANTTLTPKQTSAGTTAIVVPTGLAGGADDRDPAGYPWSVTDVIVLNGGSSSGKSSLARSLQELLDEPWVTLGVDDLLAALAPSLVGDAPPPPGRPPLLAYRADGTVDVESSYRPVEAAWNAGLAAMARAGLGVILDEVLLDGGVGQ
jgi:hypothetical protein